MTLLVRLGEGRGREGCLFHKTVDMHFSTGCFSFTLCSKKKTVSKAEIWVSLQEEKKKKRGYLHAACSLGPKEAMPHCGWAHHRTFCCHVSPHVPKKKKQACRWGTPGWFAHLCAMGIQLGMSQGGASLSPMGCSEPRLGARPVAVLVLQAALLQNRFSY